MEPNFHLINRAQRLNHKENGLTSKFHIIFGGLVFLIISLMWFFPIIFYIFLVVLYSLILVASAVIGTLYFQYLKAKPKKREIKTHDLLYKATKSNIFDSTPKRSKPTTLPVIYNRSIDRIILQIIDNGLKDFLLSWIVGTSARHAVDVLNRDLGHSGQTGPCSNLIETLREDIWSAIHRLVERARKVDSCKVLAIEFVSKITLHLEKIRNVETKMKETDENVVFTTSTYLSSDDKELEFLKKISEIMIIMLLKRGYSVSPMKELLCEILAFKLFFSTIKLITTPDFINQNIVNLVEEKLAAAALNRRVSYEYASSYQDFLKLINNCNSSDELLVMRQSILSDLLQATKNENLQRAKGADSEASSKRSEIIATVKLKRYIQQLSFAKNQCEKALENLGWTGNLSDHVHLSLNEILASLAGRRYFTLFLESLNAQNLVGYYTTVEELRNAPVTSWNQLGCEIFYTFIRAPNCEIKLDKRDRKEIEEFLMGDSTPIDVFFKLQDSTLELLESKYYQPFLLSEEYKLLKEAEDLKEMSTLKHIRNSGESQDESDSTLTISADEAMDLENYSTYAKTKLEQLHEKLKNKVLAQEALKSSVKPEATILSILEKEIAHLRNEKRQLEAHLTRTEVWSEHLGKWRANVESVEVPEEKDTPEFVIVVQVDELPREATEEDNYESDNISTGWVVLRSLNEFWELHRKIQPLCMELKSVDLPSNNAFILFFVKNDKSSLNKAKLQVQKYLNFILEDQKLNQSEAVYAFLSPSSDHLKQIITPSPKKSKFSLSTLFKSGSSTDSSKTEPLWSVSEEDDVDISLYMDGAVVGDNGDSADGNGAKDNDSIAEPLYALMDEVFEMKGLFKWVRKSLISFVQISYGRTINRQIRDLIYGIFEEKNLHHCFSSILKSVWPGGVFQDPMVELERTDDMKQATSMTAKQLVTENMPELLCNLVGAENCKHGVLKLFEVLQNEKYNKQLVYDLLEVLMLELFPEIKQLEPHISKDD